MQGGEESRRKGIAILPHPFAWPDRRRSLPTSIFWILLLAVGLRALAWVRIDPVAFDSALYFEMADLIRAGRWLEALAYPYPPLYPLLVAALQGLGVGAESAGLFIALVADLLVLFPLVALTRVAVGETAAWGAAFLWAIHPSAIRLGVQALTDAPTALLVAIALWAGLRGLDECRPGWAVGAGAASGLAYLLRPEGIEPALVLAALAIRRVETAGHRDEETSSFLSARHSKRPTLGKRALRRVAWVVAPLAGWALVASPYVAYISLEAGSLTLSKKKSASGFLRSLTSPSKDPGEGRQDGRPAAVTGGQGAGENRDPANIGKGELQGEAIPRGALRSTSMEKARVQLAGVGQAPRWTWLRSAATRTYLFQKPFVNEIHPLVLFLGIVGAWKARSERGAGSGRARAVLAGLLALHLGVLIGLAAEKGASYLGAHHFFLMALYAMPFAGAGLAWSLTWAGDRFRAPRWLPAVALAFLVAVTAFWLVTRRADRGVTVRPAAAWIRAQVVGTPVVVTHIAKLTYHARAERVDLGGTYDDILLRSRARSAHFVVFYPDLLPQVSHDFLTRLSSADLELAHVFPEPSPSAPDQRLEVYRLRPK